MSSPGTAGGRPRALPLWTRIAAAVLATFVLATAAGGLWLGPQAAAIAARDFDAAIESELDILAPVVRFAVAEGRPELLASISEGAGRRTLVRLTVILPDGEVVADSEHRLPIANHGDRPEFLAAMADGAGRAERRSATVSERLAYFARRIDGTDGRPVAVLRLARPLGALDAIEREFTTAVLFAAAIGLPIAVLVGWIAARRIAGPLEELTNVAARMAAGDFTSPPRPTRSDEAGRLAEALGHLGNEFSSMLGVREQARSELTAILASMSEGVLALDGDARVLHANAAVADCLGLPAIPAVGTPLIGIVRLPEISAQLRTALAGVRAAEIDVALPGTAGRVIGVGAAPIVGDGGAVRGAVLVLRDVTVVRKLERTRLDFVANVSHELRTPLAAVLGSIETLRDLGDEDPPSRELLLDTAHRHGRRLASIVDDLLVLSQIESEGDRLERGPVPLHRTIRAAAGFVTSEALARGITLTLPGPQAADVAVRGHEGRLEQVWTNLLANAVKYNRAGGSVTVSVAVDATRREAVVEVADTGPGIAAEHLPRIFERFYRVDRGRSRDQGGTGLGLAIVKHIVLAHRGRIEVDSRPGHGSTFRVRIPLAAAEAEGPPAPTNLAPS